MATLYAMAAIHGQPGKPLQVYSQAPYYANYPGQAHSTLYPGAKGPITAVWNVTAATDAFETVEILTYPSM